MTLDELIVALHEYDFSDSQIDELIKSPELTEAWLLQAREKTDLSKPAGFILSSVRKGIPPVRKDSTALLAKAKGEKPEISHEDFFVLCEEWIKRNGHSYFFDFDDERVRETYRNPVTGQIEKLRGRDYFLPDNVTRDVQALERVWKHTLGEGDWVALLTLARNVATVELNKERIQYAKGPEGLTEQAARHRMDCILRGANPTRFWGGATPIELEAWKVKIGEMDGRPPRDDNGWDDFV